MTKIENLSEISQLIRNKRNRDNLTQAEAAALCGVGTRFLSELENSKPTLQIGKVLQILRGLGLTLEITERNR